MNTPLVSINTNYTLLASSSSTSITLKDGTSYRNVKDAMAAYATSGKKKLYQNFIYSEFIFTYASSYIEKNGQKCQKIWFWHTQIYEYILIHSIYICDVIKKAKYDL